MSGARVVERPEDLDAFDLDGVDGRPEPQRVLMCTPHYFDVVDVRNAFMDGNVGEVDRDLATRQWEALRATFEMTGHDVLTIEGAPGLVDMVFCANQVLPGIDADGATYVVLSRMRVASRQDEVPYFQAWFTNRGYRVLELEPEAGRLEGQGDAIWHPGKRLLWGGYGQRSDRSAYHALAEMLDVPAITLELVDERFYHLDTAFCPLTPECAMIFPGAFTATGRRLIERMFPRLIEVTEREATRNFTCNAHVLDQRVVVLQLGATEAVSALNAAGFETVEVDTSEFLKSGGSVFCLKLMVY